ncbi:dynein axonemal assembly factor 6 isoform X1 [Paramormyrops kingsleyae]|uniref:Dynein axonemal assembly factor 6 n=2 Tax=Paramormyrops kingsleyae TaxID=1676925 RepID=A0A3B3SYF2_9TELE|nr:protein PIH1D3 isoform X1 [Paramormyrops kingsleyae]
MEEYYSAGSLQALSALLCPMEDDEDDSCSSATAQARLGPGHIGPTKQSDGTSAPYLKRSSKDIWDTEDVAEGSEFDDIADPRPQPEYDIVLKQHVGAEDLFLGMTRKDPSSMCCEDMVVKIKLPDTNAAEVILDVKEKFLDLRTPKYKLGLHLPHPVHNQKGKAQFIAEREELEVTLPMNRMLDAINLL